MKVSTKARTVHRLLFASALLGFSGLTACDPDASSVQAEAQASNEPYSDDTNGIWSHPADTLGESSLPAREQIEAFLKETGHSQYEFRGNRVVVDGDIVFHRSDFMEVSQESPALGKVAQMARSLNVKNRVTRNYVWRVSWRRGMNAHWRKAFEGALDFWSAYGQFKFVFVANKADILIIPKVDLKTLAEASWPLQPPGNTNPLLVSPGRTITYNSSSRYSDYEYALTRMIHELGHCLGFQHTDGKFNNGPSVHIPGTPEKDKESLFNAVPTFNFRGRISEGDRKAIKYMYPNLQLQNRSPTIKH